MATNRFSCEQALLWDAFTVSVLCSVGERVGDLLFLKVFCKYYVTCTKPCLMAGVSQIRACVYCRNWIKVVLLFHVINSKRNTQLSDLLKISKALGKCKCFSGNDTWEKMRDELLHTSVMSELPTFVSEAGCRNRYFLPFQEHLLLQLFNAMPPLLLFLVNHHVSDVICVF